MLWMVGYLVSGIVAVIVTVIYIMTMVPHVCGYEIDDWIDFGVDYLEVDQSKLENCAGVVLTMMLWPLKIVWIFCEVVPAMTNTYESRINND